MIRRIQNACKRAPDQRRAVAIGNDDADGRGFRRKVWRVDGGVLRNQGRAGQAGDARLVPAGKNFDGRAAVRKARKLPVCQRRATEDRAAADIVLAQKEDRVE